MVEKEKTRILVVDDEEMIRFAFKQFLKDEGHDSFLASDYDEAMANLRDYKPDIVFLDYRLPGRDGLEILQEIRRQDLKTAVIFMTAFGAMEVAIRAMQLGAYDYLTKPLDLEKIRILIQRIIEGKRSLKAFKNGEQADTPASSLNQMVGRGPAMQEIFKMIGLLTTQDVTVLISGESGVGKELVARAIHLNGPRRAQPFIAVNCGAVPDTLLEAEMFGYEKGAFTGAEAQKPGKFEVAGKGTIFLDEIGELQPLLQVKLLRVLQEKSFERVGGNTSVRAEARIIAASNKDLYEEMRTGRFRKDLFYRLHLVQIQLPPLRERKEDIPSLVEHFIRKANIEMNRDVKDITRESMNRLIAYHWPGNVRELENQIKRAMIMSREEVLPEYLFEFDPEQIPDPTGLSPENVVRIAKQYFQEALAGPDREKGIFEEVMGIVEKNLVNEALKKTHGNQKQAADLLGMHRSTLRKKIKDYDL